MVVGSKSSDASIRRVHFSSRGVQSNIQYYYGAVHLVTTKYDAGTESSGVIEFVSKSGTHKGGLEVREVWHDWRAFVMPAAFFLADLEG